MEVANRDIIERCVEYYEKLKDIFGDKFEIMHVRGHLGIKGNENADYLANIGADIMENSLPMNFLKENPI